MEYLLCGMLVYCVFREVMTYMERRDLYTRLQSRDLAEYKRATDGAKPPKSTMSPHEKAMKQWRTMYSEDKGERG